MTNTTPILDGRAWTGGGKGFGTHFVVELFESRKDLGFYHYAICCTDDSFAEYSNRPVKTEMLQKYLNAILQDRLGMQLHELGWEETPAEELVLLGDRVRAGE